MKSTITIIKSCWANKKRRDAVRETWLPFLGALNYPHKFLLGTRPKGSKKVEDITGETDLLQFPVSDKFADIAPKIQRACAWALESGYTQMVVVDDDTYVDAGRLAIYTGQAFFNGKDYTGFQGPTRTWMQGSSYIISLRAIRILSVAAELVTGTPDDVAVGKALAGVVVWQHTPRFYVGPEPNEIPLPTNELITTHKCLPDVMREIALRHDMAFGY